MESRRDAQSAGVDEGTQVEGFARFVGLQEGVDRVDHRLFAELGEQEPGALGQAAGMAIGAEQQYLTGIIGIG